MFFVFFWFNLIASGNIYLKSPESSDRKVFVEISNVGQIARVAEVDVGVGTEQAAQLSKDNRVLDRHSYI